MLMRWEFARLYYGFPGPGSDETEGGRVSFSHEGEEWEVPRDHYWTALRQLGEDGWELVAKNNSPPNAGGSGGFEFWFKRPRAA
jgi:hypothetical protein